MDKPKFNILDALIILMIVVVLVAGIYILKGPKTQSQTEVQTTPIEFQIQLTNKDYSLYEKFLAAKEASESAWVGVKERFEAEIVDVAIEPAAKITTNFTNGTAHLAGSPISYDITITFRADANETNDKIFVSGTVIRTGIEEAIHGKGFAGYGYITGVKAVTE